ncbi:tripartite tricarboxylate transporter substrate binding protein [Aquabacter sp. CN5-332]|uniref:Bug family tripartite tricarboxylate transporter substrate binding protein n=1 Tax=Aquabacter sp. CN5-332 TaxID=3156608 RepID=UPI0032B371E2
MLRRSLAALAAVTFTLLAGVTGAAAAFPDRPVRIIVPFPAGGSNDVIARLLAQNLQEQWKQPVIVDNRSGAGGNVGADNVVRADPDGYTLLLSAPGPLAINPSLYPNLPYNPLKDFAPIALVANVPIVLAVNPAVKATSVKELIALAKAEPGKLNFGSSGNGTTNHLAGELFKTLAGIDIVHVPYRGAAPAMNDLVAGHIPMMFDNMPAVRPQVTAGKIRALAVAGAQRSPLFPELPTMIEAGVPGFDASAWFGLVAPAKTSQDVLQVIIDATKKALTEPEMAKKFADLGAEPGTLFGPAFGKFIEAEDIKWAKVIKDANVKVD